MGEPTKDNPDGYDTPEKPAWLAGRRYADGPHGPVIAGPAESDRKASSGEDDRKQAPGPRATAKAAPKDAGK